ncbi:N-formylglutamate amidohydrolase [Sphingobium sp. AN558]|uniref:N-formylglutamate amidohydrolase n=1 Tax=Sphingobium sp. AN558 TaxID=3133442 RepID=UPI0030BD89FC
MAGRAPGRLLGPDDPAPFALHNAEGAAPFLLTGDHAGNAVPAVLGGLGVASGELSRHIGIDIGVRGLGEALSGLLDAPFIHQPYSRLVIDCNRDPALDEAIPGVSDATRIPGNEALSAADRAARIAEIHAPYHGEIAAMLEARASRGRPTILLALHSFTPVLGGERRPWDAGVLHWQGDVIFALRLLRALREESGLTIGDNAPYAMDATDHSVPRHAFARAIPYAEIEVRQDLIGNAAGQAHWAELLAHAARRASVAD